MHLSSVLALAGCVSNSLAAYTLVQDYTSDNFFSEFTFFSVCINFQGTLFNACKLIYLQEADPTEGYVTYVDQATAEAAGLISTENGAIYMGVDSTNVASGSGRESVRVSSNFAFDTGLIIADIQHMPGSICGTWPAL